MKKWNEYYEKPIVERASVSHLRRMEGLADQNHLKAMMKEAKKVGASMMEDDDFDEKEIVEFLMDYIKNNY